MKNKIGTLLALMTWALTLQVNVASAYYDPELGRFIQPDMTIPDLSNPQSYNRYSYVLNDPLTLNDPSGHSALDYIPYIGPGVAEIRGNAALESTSQRLGFISYAQARQSLGIGQATAGNVNMVAGVGKVTAGAANAYLTGGQEIATAGIVTGPILIRKAGQALARGTAEGAAETAASSLEQRAKELHGLLDPRAQRMRTTAVTETEEGVRYVSSSKNALSKAQKAALQPGEVAAVGPGHAEITGVNAAKQAGLTPTATAASRPICPTCAQALKEQGVTPASPLKVPQ